MRKIATKVTKKLKKVTANRIVDLGEYRKQKIEVENLFSEVNTMEEFIESGKDPLHAIYTHAQNLLAILVEVLNGIQFDIEVLNQSLLNAKTNECFKVR